MRPFVFLLPHAVVFWVIFIWAFLPEYKIIQSARAEAKKEGSKDAGSVKFLMLVMQTSSLVAFPLAWFTQMHVSEPTRLAVFYGGVAMLALGSVLRRLCWKALGEHFTGDVRARAGQPVIQTGPYRWVRHPSYTAGILMNVGIAFALTSWPTVGILFVASIVAYAYRVRVEERAMVSEIGAPYAEFIRTRKRFVPFLI
jgi:protein-S-isoprenylcysteine O-methyltransferase Ste14